MHGGLSIFLHYNDSYWVEIRVNSPLLSPMMSIQQKEVNNCIAIDIVAIIVGKLLIFNLC